MDALKKNKIYFDTHGEYLLDTKDVVEMTPELEMKLHQSIHFINECGYFVNDGSEVSKKEMDYHSKNHVTAYLFLSVLILVTCSIAIFKDLLYFAILELCFTIILLFCIYYEVKKH